MARVNKMIDLLEQGQPVYYENTREFTFEEGLRLASTWADYIRLDLEHGPFDMKGVREFMLGLVEGGPTASGHPTPAVIAELPTDGSTEAVMQANAWMVKQVLAQGVHGVILCHCECPEAARVFVESARFPFHKQGVGEGVEVGRRGYGAQMTAAEIWSVSQREYLDRADVWPLNPDGEIMLGVKIENLRGLERMEEILAVPGLSFSEWGPGDMGMNLGYPMHHDPPYPEDMRKVREAVRDASFKNNLYFLDPVTAGDVIELIEEGVMICKPLDGEAAEVGRKHTNRPKPY